MASSPLQTVSAAGVRSAGSGPGKWRMRVSYALLFASFAGLSVAAYWRSRPRSGFPPPPVEFHTAADPGGLLRPAPPPADAEPEEAPRVEAALDEAPEGRLVFAAATGDLGGVHDLLASGVTPDAENREGRRALHLAAANGEVEIARTLLDAGATVDASDGIGWGALHWAAYYGSLPSVEALLTAGADPNARYEPHRVTVLEQLLSGLRSAETRGGVPFRVADRLAITEALFAAGADPNLGGPYGPPLRLAPHLDRRLVLALLDHGARVDDLPELRRMTAHSGVVGLRFREAFREADLRAGRTPPPP